MWVVTMPCCDYFYIHSFFVQIVSHFTQRTLIWWLFFKAYRYCKVLTFRLWEVLLVGWPQEHLRGFGCNFKWRNFGHISVLAAGQHILKVYWMVSCNKQCNRMELLQIIGVSSDIVLYAIANICHSWNKDKEPKCFSLTCIVRIWNARP